MNLKISILAFLTAAFFSCSEQINTAKEKSLLDLLENEQLFKLREVYAENQYKISEQADLRIQASLFNTFNKNLESNTAIDRLLTEFSDELPDSIKTDLILLKADNYLKLFDYQGAFETNNIIINEYALSMDSLEYAEAVNMRNIYEPLIGTPPQLVQVENDNYIPLSRDVVGLMNVSVRFGEDYYNLIFDTGAGMSVVKRSFANKIGLKMLETSIDANAATGKVVKTSLAVCDSLSIGDILITNTVFLVLEDEALDFPQANFFPLGAIGFPVIEEMKEISITKTDTLLVKKNQTPGIESNMRLDGLQPMVYLYNGTDTLAYAFDTGATRSHFSAKYYQKYKDFLAQNSVQDTVSTSSAGGSAEHLTYRLDSTFLHIGQQRAMLYNIHVHTKDNVTFESVYGNLGQDLIRQFDRLTLNFEQMFLQFN